MPSDDYDDDCGADYDDLDFHDDCNVHVANYDSIFCTYPYIQSLYVALII